MGGPQRQQVSVMKTLCILLALLLPVTAFAQEAPPTEYQLTEPA